MNKVTESTKQLMSGCMSVAACACLGSRDSKAPRTPKAANIRIALSPVVSQPRSVVHILSASDESQRVDSGHTTNSPTDSPAIYL